MNKIDGISYEGLAKWIQGKVTKRDKQAFFSSLICSAFGYFYFATNFIPNNDGLTKLYWTDSVTFTSGRWSQAFLSSIGSGIYSPFFLAVVAFVALALITVLIVRVFDVRRFFAVFSIAAILSLNPSTVSTVPYLYMLDGFFIGLLLGVIGVYLTERYKYGVLIGIVLLSVSMGEYQMFLCFVIAFFAVRLIQVIIQGQANNKQVLFFGLKYTALILGGLILYLIINKIVLSQMNLSLTSYRGLDKMGQIDMSHIIRGILSAYEEFFPYIVEINSLFCGGFVAFGAVCTLIVSLVLGIWLLFSRKMQYKFQLVVFFLVLLCLPVLLDSIFLTGVENATLAMRYPMCFVYILGIMMIEESAKDYPAPQENVTNEKRTRTRDAKALFISLSTWAVLFSTILLCFSWGVVANESATIIEIKNRNGYALCLRIVDRIEQFPDFSASSTPVTVIGKISPQNSNYPDTKGYFSKYKEITGISSPEDYSYLYADYQYFYYINNFIGLRYINAGYDVNTIRKTNAFQNMPCFPEEGALQMIDGVLVVKMAEEK